MKKKTTIESDNELLIAEGMARNQFNVESKIDSLIKPVKDMINRDNLHEYMRDGYFPDPYKVMGENDLTAAQVFKLGVIAGLIAIKGETNKDFRSKVSEDQLEKLHDKLKGDDDTDDELYDEIGGGLKHIIKMGLSKEITDLAKEALKDLEKIKGKK